MPADSRFKAWNIFDSALVKNANGHHYWETSAIVDELVRRGETVRLFTHRDAPGVEQFSRAEIVPTFSLNLWDQISEDPLWAGIENFVVHNRSFQADLSRVDASLFRDSLALFPTLRENQLLGLFRWMDGVPREVRPKVAACLFPPLSPAHQATRLYKGLWNGCPPELRKGIAWFCRTSRSADAFGKYTGIPARALPFAGPLDALPPKSGAPEGPMVVSFVGGARLERGTLLVADVVKQCAGLDVRFFIQAKHGSVGVSDSAALAGLSGRSNVRLAEGVLGRDDYYRAIAGTVVLLAYQPGAYRWRSSGVYQEALMLDAPVLVTAGTWMAEAVRRSGNGLPIEGHSVAAIVSSIALAQRKLPALRAAAVRVGEEFRRTQGVARYIDMIAGAFERGTVCSGSASS